VRVCVRAGARQPPLVGAVEALVEGRAGSPEFDSYAVFDPKVGVEEQVASVQRHRAVSHSPAVCEHNNNNVIHIIIIIMSYTGGP